MLDGVAFVLLICMIIIWVAGFFTVVFLAGFVVWAALCMVREGYRAVRRILRDRR